MSTEENLTVLSTDDLLDRFCANWTLAHLSTNEAFTAKAQCYRQEVERRLKEHERAKHAFSPATDSEGDPIIT